MATVITGATGFVAASVARALVESGRRVIVVDLRPPTALVSAYISGDHRQAIWRFAQADVSDFDQLWQAAGAGAEAIDEFVHMAAITPSPEMEAADPLRIIRVNAFGTATALEVARRLGVKRFVVTSSAAVYAGSQDLQAAGYGPDAPIDEAAPFRRDRVYSITKQNVERLITYYTERFGLETAATRICAVYGPMERPTGARPIMSPIYQMVHRALANQPITVDATALDTSRDWIHAADVARGLLSLLDGPPPAQRVYNLAPGVGVSLAETLATVAKVLPNFVWRPAPADQADIVVPLDARRGALDSSRLQSERGFRPQYTLETGLRQYVEWLATSGAGLEAGG